MMSSGPELVVVTALIVQPGGVMTHGLDAYVASLRDLVAAGVPTLLYLDAALPVPARGPNLRIERIRFDELATVAAVAAHAVALPAARNVAKDTPAYLCLMNAKSELILRAHAAGHRARRYAWVDAGLFRLITDVAGAQARLRGLARLDPAAVWMPGCNPAPSGDLDRVDWRFCGGFLAGGAWPVLDLCERHVRLVRDLLPRLTWEVNAWALLEQRGDIRPRWYEADHDDRILALPDQALLAVDADAATSSGIAEPAAAGAAGGMATGWMAGRPVR
jgi:hypothetical protein